MAWRSVLILWLHFFQEILHLQKWGSVRTSGHHPRPHHHPLTRPGQKVQCRWVQGRKCRHYHPLPGPGQKVQCRWMHGRKCRHYHRQFFPETLHYHIKVLYSEPCPHPPSNRALTTWLYITVCNTICFVSSCPTASALQTGPLFQAWRTANPTHLMLQFLKVDPYFSNPLKKGVWVCFNT